jgi:EAL domain-containing protein (putative c-di-GMP-specific phosphodiesterase class I)
MKADVAMDKAKANQGSALAFFDESLNKATEIRVAVESRPSTVMEQSTACLLISERAKLGLQRVAINLSSQQFSRAGFADSLLQELARVDLKANKLELELTESVFINDAEQIVSELLKLRTAGVHVAPDDFGTGYSFLNMLRSLPLDTIKIDRSFIIPLT